MAGRDLEAALNRAIAEYMDTHSRSREMFERAKSVLPGGNTRTGVYFDPFPLYADFGQGVYLHDLDGNKLLDFVNNNTALMLGHAHPDVVRALQDQIAGGTAFSRPTPLEVEMAELLQERVPSMERMRFCSSGTEAVLNALRVARAFTGKGKVAKFEGAYHGVEAHAMISYMPPLGPELGPEDRPHSVVSSAGLPPSTADEVVVLPFNDGQACRALIEENADDLAAVIVDPLMTASGLTLPEDGFLNRLREMTEQHGVLLVFDEIVSFRAARGGTQERYGVRPDLTCMGKVVAGGTPGAVMGGRADVLAAYDPTVGAKIQQSGTYNGNPLAMVAGMVTLRKLTPEVYEALADRTSRLGTALTEAFAQAGVTACVVTVGSLFRVYFLPDPPRNYRESARDDGAMHKWLFFSLLNSGIYWKVGGNVSVPMTDEHTDTLVAGVKEALKTL
ncbi:MAG: aspartate aminotransferase family protein [bacterium]|nr:aspartate aminotransferase family protein [bacterium]